VLFRTLRLEIVGIADDDFCETCRGRIVLVDELSLLRDLSPGRLGRASAVVRGGLAVVSRKLALESLSVVDVERRAGNLKLARSGSGSAVAGRGVMVYQVRARCSSTALASTGRGSGVRKLCSQALRLLCVGR
jgi:hypothetical protein